MLGSAPNALDARDWPRAPFDRIVVINNAWRIRDDWDDLCCPWDFPEDRRPRPRPGQRLILQEEFVPAQNLYGGFVYAGGTMAFTTAYWMLAALKPQVIAVLGCDMQYPTQGPTHFYGTGTPDPLREDITLRSLEAKSARLMILAARQGCAMVNLSTQGSRLVFPRARRDALDVAPAPYDTDLAEAALAREAELGYYVPSGRYWQAAERFDPAEIDALDAMWLAAAQVTVPV
ncbi:hypothetical protein GC209_11480 [bacterium]|nr:hypothetical protein [bacterium]